MVALREKITAWLFVLNSCLRASNCSQGFSSLRAGCQPPASFLATAPSQQEAQRGDLSPDTPPLHLTGHLLVPHPLWLLLKLSRRRRAPAPGATANRKAPGMMLSHGEGALWGILNLAGASQFHAAPCEVAAAHQGHPCQVLRRCGFAAGDAGIWPQHGTEVSRLAPDPSSPCRGKLSAT